MPLHTPFAKHRKGDLILPKYLIILAKPWWKTGDSGKYSRVSGIYRYPAIAFYFTILDPMGTGKIKAKKTLPWGQGSHMK